MDSVSAIIWFGGVPAQCEIVSGNHNSSTGTDPNNRIGIKGGGVYFARSDKFYVIDEIRDEDNSFTKDNPVVNNGDLMKAILFTGPDYLDSDLGVTAIQNNETMGESSLAIDPRSTMSVQMTSEGGGSITVDLFTPSSYGIYASVDLYP